MIPLFIPVILPIIMKIRETIEIIIPKKPPQNAVLMLSSPCCKSDFPALQPREYVPQKYPKDIITVKIFGKSNAIEKKMGQYIISKNKYPPQFRLASLKICIIIIKNSILPPCTDAKFDRPYRQASDDKGFCANGRFVRFGFADKP